MTVALTFEKSLHLVALMVAMLVKPIIIENFSKVSSIVIFYGK